MKVSINLQNNVFEINFEKKININTKFTLESFKLINQESNEGSSFLGSKDNINIENILKYLQNNNFKIFISDKVNKLIDSKREKIKKYKEKINFLKSIKSNVNKKDYEKFCNSINFLFRALKPHQSKSLHHLYNAECAANFSVPGSGKNLCCTRLLSKT